MLLSLPLRVHLLRCIEDREMTHAEVVDSSVMLRIWTVYRELGIKGFPVHWAPPIRVRCVICFVFVPALVDLQPACPPWMAAL